MTSITTQSVDTRNAPKVMHVTIPITMNSREAEHVQWQDTGGKLSHLKGTLGELMTRKAIHASNLAYMVDKGETPALREACRVLLARWLEAAPATGTSVRRSPEVVEGSTYLVDQREDSLVTAAAYATGAILMSLLLAVGLAQSAFSLIAKGAHWTLVLVAVAICLVVVGVPIGIWLYRAMMSNMRRYRDFYQGQAAENWFVDQLRGQLDSRWTIFRNLQLPGRKSDLDVVLVGPAGVWVFEVKGYRPPVRLVNDKWSIQAAKKWKQLNSNPLRQAASNAKHLHEFLTRFGVTRYVEKAVVLSEPQAAENFGEVRDGIWLRFETTQKLTELKSGSAGTGAIAIRK